MKTKLARNTLLVLLAFLALGALFGGSIFIISPSGRLMGMPVTALAYSPFTNFLIPGIILFGVLGVVPLLLTFALVRKPENKWAEKINAIDDMHWTWTYSLYVAFALVIWIQVEMVILGAVHWLHTFYMMYALAIIALLVLPSVRNDYKKTLLK